MQKCNDVKVCKMQLCEVAKVLSLLGFGYLEMISLLGVYYYIIYRVKVCGVAGNVVFIGIWNTFRLSGGTRAFRQSGRGKRRGEDGCWWREKSCKKGKNVVYFGQIHMDFLCFGDGTVFLI